MFRALVLEKPADRVECAVKEIDEAQLPEGNVTVRIDYSTLNYKDGLAVTGQSPVVRFYPMVPGIDFAGTVETSSHPAFAPGDKVVLNGWGLGERHWGGYAETMRVNGDWLIPLPAAFTTAQAMAIGTAGYTAALAVLALEEHGIRPDRGNILVTGAAGGVGSIAVALLARSGYRVLAATGRTQEADYLRGLGAADIIGRELFAGPVKPLERERWAGAVDSVGSVTLAHVLAGTQYRGCVAACGLAQGMDLPTSVAPFILRGVTLAGIDSVAAPKEQRLAAWSRLARDLDKDILDAMTAGTIGLSEVAAKAPEILAGQVRGRLIVDVRR